MPARRVIAAFIAVSFAGAVVLAAVAPFIGGGGGGGGDDSGVAVTASTSARATPLLPDVTISDLAGRPVSLRSLIGRPLIINYWYSTCPPCKAEMPAFAQVAAEFGDRVRFVGVNPQDSAETARAFAADRGVTYEQYLDHTNRSVDALGLTGFPSTVFVTADGRIVTVQRAAMTAAELRTLIRTQVLA